VRDPVSEKKWTHDWRPIKRPYRFRGGGVERESPALLRWPRTALLLLHCSIRLARARKCWSRPPRREATLPAIRHLLPASRHAHHFFAATSFITSISRSRSLPLSTPPGATSRILPGPIIATGFAPASVGVHRIEVAYYISSGNAGECAFVWIGLDRALLVCGRQCGQTSSAPTIPHLVQTIRENRDRTSVSSASQSAFTTEL
jgi:hypothetical protein